MELQEQVTLQRREGKTYAALEELSLWEKNPRESSEEDMERLEELLQRLPQFKPLLCTNDGTVIGGNMRLQAMRSLGWEEAWVEVIDAENEQQMVEIALADNDRVGRYITEDVETLLEEEDVDEGLFRPDTLAPEDLTTDDEGPADDQLTEEPEGLPEETAEPLPHEVVLDAAREAGYPEEVCESLRAVLEDATTPDSENV